MTDPKTKISDKAQRAVEYYIANTIIMPIVGYTWANAMTKAGYADSTVKKNSHDTWVKVGVQEQITAARAQIRVKAETIAEQIARMYEAGYDVAEKQSNPTGMATNTTGLARLNGLLTDVIKGENKVLGINVLVKE